MQFAATISDFIQLEKTRKKLEVYWKIDSEYLTFFFVTPTPPTSPTPPPPFEKLEKLEVSQFANIIPDFIKLENLEKTRINVNKPSEIPL